MLLNALYAFEKTESIRTRKELNFWFTILVNGERIYNVCAKQFITFYKQNKIICLFN